MIASWISKYLLVALGIGGIIGGAFWYHNNMQNRIVDLSADRERTESLLRQTRAELNAIREDYDKVREREQLLVQQAREAEEYSDELLQLLRRHDLTALTRARPGLIQNRVNNATEEVFKDIESITRND